MSKVSLNLFFYFRKLRFFRDYWEVDWVIDSVNCATPLLFMCACEMKYNEMEKGYQSIFLYIFIFCSLIFVEGEIVKCSFLIIPKGDINSFTLRPNIPKERWEERWVVSF